MSGPIRQASGELHHPTIDVHLPSPHLDAHHPIRMDPLNGEVTHAGTWQISSVAGL